MATQLSTFDRFPVSETSKKSKYLREHPLLFKDARPLGGWGAGVDDFDTSMLLDP
jgi:hypothetical protein